MEKTKYDIPITFNDLTNEKQDEILRIIKGKTLRKVNNTLAIISLEEGKDFFSSESTCKHNLWISDPDEKKYVDEDREFENNYEFVIREDGVIIKKYVGFDLQEITIPDSYGEKPIIGIDREAFCKMRYLEKLNLGKNLLFIGEYAFCECKSLMTIQWNMTLRAIEVGAFQRSGLKKVYIPESVDYIGASVFAETGVMSVVLPEHLTAISNRLWC